MSLAMGIVGAGDVVRRAYLPDLSRRSDCKLVAISSQHGHSARELASLYAIGTVYRSYGTLLGNPEIDTVLICTPPHLHKEIAEAAMKCNKNILVEKPLCTNYQDSVDLLRQAYRYSKTFYVAFNNQFREENQWLRSKVFDGDLGNIELIDLEWYRTKRYEHKAWLYDPVRSGGGVLMDLGSHMIHFALSLIPGRSRFVVYCVNPSNGQESSVEAASASLVTVDKKILIVVKLGWDMKLPVASQVVLRVYGDQGSLSNDNYHGEKTDGYSHMINDFVCHTDAKAKPDLRLVQDTMLLLDAMYQSGRSGSAMSGEFYAAGES